MVLVKMVDRPVYIAIEHAVSNSRFKSISRLCKAPRYKV